jgi:hypothetical protein
MASAKKDTKDRSSQWKKDKPEKAQTFAASSSSTQKENSSSDDEEKKGFVQKFYGILENFTKRQEIAEE